MNFLNDEEVGKRLVALRGETSSRQIAIQAGIDTSQYSKIEKGKLSITEAILNKLIKSHNWDGNFILHGHGTNIPNNMEDVIVTTNYDELMSYALESNLAFKAAITVFKQEIIKINSQLTKRPEEDVLLEIDKKLQEELKLAFRLQRQK